MRRLLGYDHITGITTWHDYDSSTRETKIHYTFEDAQTDAVLDNNHRMANHNDGWSKSRELRRVADIPMSVMLSWYVEKGIDVLNKRHWPEVRKLLNDPDWRKLRTANWHV